MHSQEEDVSLKRATRANQVSSRDLSRIKEHALQIINDPNPHLASFAKTTMSSAQVATNKLSIAQFMAAKTGDVKRLNSLLVGVDDPDIRLLHIAAEEGHRNVVMSLASQFPLQLNQKDELYQTALHLAVRKNHVAVVQYLVNQPLIELDCQDGYHRTPLHIAAGAGEMRMVDELWKRGINLESRDLDGRTPLHYAASEGHSHVVKTLTNAQTAANSMVAGPNAQDKRGCTPLHLAAYNKQALRAFKILIELPHVRCWDVQNQDGYTPLHFAAQAGNTDAVSQLQKLSFDAAISNISCVWRQTPLHIAAAAGHVEVIRIIRKCVEHESNQLTELACGSDAIGRTPLHYAALYGHVDVVEELNNWGKSVMSVLENKDSGGFTALHLAAREGHVKVVQYLIAASANIHVKAGNSTMCEYLRSSALLQQGLQESLMSLDFVPSQGMSALHFAARGGHVLVVEELCKSQQKLVTSAVDDNNLTPADWAAINGSLDLFLQHPVNEKLSWRPSELSSSRLKEWHEKWKMEKQEALAYQLQLHKNMVRLQAGLSFPRGDPVKSVVHRAASRGDVELLSELLSLPQADVNEQDIAGNTPAHLAARYGHTSALRVLLSHPKCDINKKNHWQDTPFRLAFDGNHVEACRMILKLRNCEGEENLGMLLREAIRKDLFEMCTMLAAQEGARVMDQGRTDGKTPLQIAKEKGSRYVEVLLRKEGVRRMLSEERRGFKATADAILVASTLIASITYQGWLQPPRPQSNSANPGVGRALNSFWWLNSFSFYLAIATMLVGAVGSLPTPRTQLTDSVARARWAVSVACVLLTLATMSVMGAFGAAGLAVIWPNMTAIVVPLSGGSLLCMGVLLWFANRLYRLCSRSSSWEFVSRDNQEPSITARLLDFTPASSGPR